MKTSEVPILIVGGGAAGTMLSLELARRGVEFRTVDRLPGPQATSRAIGVHARTLEMIERIDEDLAGKFLSRGIENKGYILHFVDEDGRRSEVRPGLDFTTLDCRYPFVLIHGQSDTENYLREFLQQRFGRATEWSTRCVDVSEDSDGVTAMLEHAGGEEERVRCQYLVACDGINSTVRRALALSQEESDYAGTVLQNMDVFLNDFPDVEDYVHYCSGTDHFIMIVKLPGGYFRLLLSDRGEAARSDVAPEQGFLRLVDRHFDGVSLGEIVWHSKWESWVRLAVDYRKGNVFLAGDSAHVHSTTGGQGMNCCMQDACNLGWKLAMVMQGTAAPDLLDSYEQERRPIAEQVIWAASALHDIFMGHGQDIAERARQITDPAFLEAVVGRCSGIAYTYRDYMAQPAGLTELNGVSIGDRAPDVALADGRTLFDLTRHTGFTLLGFAAPSADREALETTLQRLAGRFRERPAAHVLESTPELAHRFGRDDRGVVCLLRPDGYVGYRCTLGEAERLEAHLAQYGLRRWRGSARPGPSSCR